MKVFKFGGASIKDADAIKNISSILSSYRQDRLVIVVSAMGKTTRNLENLINLYIKKGDYLNELEKIKHFHNDIIRQLFPDSSEVWDILKDYFLKLQYQLEQKLNWNDYDLSYDQIVSLGEVISSEIIARYLLKEGHQLQWVDARDFVQTDSTWREGKVDWAWTEKAINKELHPILHHKNIITQGFIGKTISGLTTTLGKEGSDYTAAIFASCLKAESVTVWKDVPGIMNADPKKLSQAEMFEELSFRELAEMSYYGASVIHPKTTKPLANRSIPLYVRSFLHPHQNGTCVSHQISKKNLPIVIYKSNQTLITFEIKDFTYITERNLGKILNALSKCNIKINLMQNSAISISVCIDKQEEKIKHLKYLLSDEFNILDTDNDKYFELITIKNYHNELIEELTGDQYIILTQKTLDYTRMVVMN